MLRWLAVLAATLAAAAYAEEKCRDDLGFPHSTPRKVPAASACPQFAAKSCCDVAHATEFVTRRLEPFFHEKRIILGEQGEGRRPLTGGDASYTRGTAFVSVPPSAEEAYLWAVPEACRTAAATVLCARCSPAVGTGAVMGVCPGMCDAWLAACADVLFAPDPDTPGRVVPCADLAVLAEAAAAEPDANSAMPVSFEQVVAEARLEFLSAHPDAAASPLMSKMKAQPQPRATPVTCAPLRAIMATGRELCAAYDVPVADTLASHPGFGDAAAAIAAAALRSETGAAASPVARAQDITQARRRGGVVSTLLDELAALAAADRDVAGAQCFAPALDSNAQRAAGVASASVVKARAYAAVRDKWAGYQRAQQAAADEPSALGRALDGLATRLRYAVGQTMWIPPRIRYPVVRALQGPAREAIVLVLALIWLAAVLTLFGKIWALRTPPRPQPRSLQQEQPSPGDALASVFGVSDIARDVDGAASNGLFDDGGVVGDGGAASAAEDDADSIRNARLAALAGAPAPAAAVE